MNRYKIFFITGETVEVLADSVKVMIDGHGHVNRYDFIEKNDVPICATQPTAIFYSEYIMGWAELPELTEIGHWIMHQDHRECSKCGVYLLKDMPRNSYCPNCGTKMSESEGKK